MFFSSFVMGILRLHLSYTLLSLLILPLSWPWVALQVKRWHDRDKSAMWLLLILVPGIGGIWTWVECGFLCGTVGKNEYGEDPIARRTE
jgi:uncharacterized membrane protein YhaH (DUF805 family)